LLKPGGVLILDLINPRQVHNREGVRDWGKGVSSYGYWDHKKKRFLESYAIKNGVYKFKPLISLRIYDVQEIKNYLKAAGFDSSPAGCSIYGKFSDTCPPYDDHSPRMIVVTSKI